MGETQQMNPASFRSTTKEATGRSNDRLSSTNKEKTTTLNILVIRAD
jgi:hypothetical protein